MRKDREASRESIKLLLPFPTPQCVCDYFNARTKRHPVPAQNPLVRGLNFFQAFRVLLTELLKLLPAFLKKTPLAEKDLNTTPT